MKDVSKVSQVICGIMIVGVIFYYYNYVFSHSFNAYYAPDDLLIFLEQHLAFKAEGPSHIFQYLVSISKYPHPKISARIFALLSEAFTGEINFKLIQIIGNFGFLVLLFVIRKVLDLKWDFVKLLTFSLLFFVPIVNTFWTISIASLPWLFVFLLMTIYYFIHEKPFAAILFSFLTVFTSGQGFLVLPVVGLLLLRRTFQQRKLIRSDLIWIVGATFISILYYFVVLDVKFENSDASVVSLVWGNVDTNNLLDRISTYFSFFAVYPLRSIGDYHFDKRIGAVIGVLLFLLFAFLSNKTFKKHSNQTSLIFFLYSCFFILQGILAVFISLSNKLSNEFTIPGRYEIHSMLFIASLFALSLACLPKVKSVKYIILAIALFFYVQKAPKNYQNFDAIKHSHFDAVHFTLGQNADKVEFSEANYNTLIEAKLDGLYKIPSDVLIKAVTNPSYKKSSIMVDSLAKKVVVDRFFEDEHFLYSNWYTFKNQKSLEVLNQYFLLVDERNEKEYYFSPYYSNKITRKEKKRFAVIKQKGTLPVYTGALIEKSHLGHLKSTYSAYAVVIIEENEVRIPLHSSIEFGR